MRSSAGRIGPRGRLHAIWILARVQGDKAIEPLLTIARSDPEPSVRAQAVRAIADLADPVLARHRLDAGPGDRSWPRAWPHWQRAGSPRRT